MKRLFLVRFRLSRALCQSSSMRISSRNEASLVLSIHNIPHIPYLERQTQITCSGDATATAYLQCPRSPNYFCGWTGLKGNLKSQVSGKDLVGVVRQRTVREEPRMLLGCRQVKARRRRSLGKRTPGPMPAINTLMTFPITNFCPT